jgi:hypothetical protein
VAYRNKAYVCVEYDSDKNYYNTLKMWKNNEKFDFTFYNAHELNNIMYFSNEETIKRKLRERMLNSKMLIVLIGERTKFHHKYVVWEIKLAQKLDIPIIALNINKVNGIDKNLCPTCLKGEKVVHIPFSKEALRHAMDVWPSYYHNIAKNDDKIDYFYEHLALK